MIPPLPFRESNQLAWWRWPPRSGAYAKSLLQARLKYLSLIEKEFHCLMRLSLTHFSIPELFLGASRNKSDSFKTHIDYLQVPRQSIISHSVYVPLLYWVLLRIQRQEICIGVPTGHAICFAVCFVKLRLWPVQNMEMVITIWMCNALLGMQSSVLSTFVGSRHKRDVPRQQKDG